MRLLKSTLLLKLCLVLMIGGMFTGCTSLRTGMDNMPTFEYKGPIQGYCSVKDLRQDSSEIIQLDFLSARQQDGELLNIDIWPIGGIGIGALGIRGHIFTLGAGFGIGMYDPQAADENILDKMKKKI